MSDLSVIKKFKVAELKAALSERGLSVKGKKDDLVKRLVEAMEADEQAAESPEPEVTEEPVEEEAMETCDGKEVETEETHEEEPPDKVDEENSANNEVADENDGTADAPTEQETPQHSDSSTEKKDEGDWVMVEPPSAEESSAVEEASEPQSNAVVESTSQSNTEESNEVAAPESEQPVQEATVDTPSAKVETETDVEMKEGTESVPSTDSAPTSKETPSTESSDAKPEASDKKTEDNKVESKTDGKETEKKADKKEIIPDVMVEVEEEEGEEFIQCDVPEGQVGLDQYTSDLNFVISNNGLSGRNLIKNGFSYMWAGARGNKGARGGKLGYEVKITKFEEVDLPDTESPVNAIRIGWSAETTNLQLGEASLSYGFESTGKVCASSSFFQYGGEFGEGDVIGTYLDLESEPKTLRYTKNGVDLDVAMSLTVNLEEKPLFPHILVRNVAVEVNFGGLETPWFETPEGYTLLQKASEEFTTNKTSARIPEDEDCEVLMMVGLPSSGKSSWVRKYCDSHPDKHYNVIGMSQLIDRCKLEGKKRSKNDKNHEEIMKALMKALTKLYQMCPKRRRNFIYDQNNVYKIAQDKKMELFQSGYKRKAVVIVPTHDNLRRRTSEMKRKGDNIHDVPFADLCDMKCEFTVPATGEIFEDVTYPELDEKNAAKTVRDYHSDGTRAKKTGRDDFYPKKRARYDDRRRDNRYGGGGRDRRDDGWRGSGSGYGGSGGGYHKRHDSGGYNKGGNRSHSNYQDPYRRHSGGGGGGNYRQSSGGGGGGYRSGGNYGSSGGGGYGQNYGGYGQSQSYGSYGSQNYGNYGNYGGNYNQGGGSNRSSTGHWGQQQQQQQYGSYNQSQSSQQQGWGTGGQWGGYNYNSGGSNYNSGGGYSY